MNLDSSKKAAVPQLRAQREEATGIDARVERLIQRGEDPHRGMDEPLRIFLKGIEV